jgi:putative membrane protein insertion efficiency factor
MTRGTKHSPGVQAHALYKRWLSPMLHTAGHTLFPGGCRFQPTCSEYALLAFRQHGTCKGFLLAASRLLRCHPFFQGGWDPVPPPMRRRVFPAVIEPATPAGTIREPHSTHDLA